MVHLTAAIEPHDGFLDTNLAEPKAWFAPPFPHGDSSFAAVLFGDEQAGPFAAFYSTPPGDRAAPPTPGHGHGSDSWRISFEGAFRVGAQHYTSGGFRFQEGGKIYGADTDAAGPDGGYMIVMMGDRRGAGAIPANPADQAKFDAASALFSDWLGVSYVNRAEGQGVATTLGKCHYGRLDGSFQQEWPEILPGVQLAAGLVGHREYGPIVLLTKAEPGRTAFPALTIGAEVMHMVIQGEARQGDADLNRYAVRLVTEATPAKAIVAGSSGVWLASVIGDRRAWPAAASDAAGKAFLGDIKNRIVPLFAELEAQLAPAQ